MHENKQVETFMGFLGANQGHFSCGMSWHTAMKYEGHQLGEQRFLPLAEDPRGSQRHIIVFAGRRAVRRDRVVCMVW